MSFRSPVRSHEVVGRVSVDIGSAQELRGFEQVAKTRDGNAYTSKTATITLDMEDKIDYDTIKKKCVHSMNINNWKEYKVAIGYRHLAARTKPQMLYRKMDAKMLREIVNDQNIMFVVDIRKYTRDELVSQSEG